MRAKLVRGLNDLLEFDHDIVAGVMTKESFVDIDSNLKDYTPQSKISALTILNLLMEGEAITPLWENGFLQKFI